MATTHRGDHASDDNANDADFGQAVTRLQESMDGLSKDMSGLEVAIQKLETSTRNLSDTQRQISDQMARAADELRTGTQSTARIDNSPTATPADD